MPDRPEDTPSHPNQDTDTPGTEKPRQDSSPLPDRSAFQQTTPLHPSQVPKSAPKSSQKDADTPTTPIRREVTPSALSPSFPRGVPDIKGYRLIEELGHGALGTVWRARHQRLDVDVALKLFDHNVGKDWKYLRREIECLLRVGKHPNIVTVLDADFDQKPPFFAMELIQGSVQDRMDDLFEEAAKKRGLLRDKIQWIPWPDIPEVVRWFKEIASGLLYIHGKAFLHCDLKPGNVMIDEDGHMRIVDFGQALFYGRDKLSTGTFFYMPPEQVKIWQDREKIQPDVRWDIYALGATIYAILTGRPPRSGDEIIRSLSTGSTLVERLHIYHDKLLTAELVPLLEVNPLVPSTLAAIVEKCLTLDPEKRYESITEVLDDLERIRSHQPLIAYRPWKRSYLLGCFVKRNALWLVPLAGLITVLGVSMYQIQKKFFEKQMTTVTILQRDGSEVSATVYANTSPRKAMDEALEQSYIKVLDEAKADLSQGDTAKATAHLDSCPMQYRGWEWGRLLFIAQRHTGPGAPSLDLGIQKISGLPVSGSHFSMNPNGFLFIIHSESGEAKVLGVADGKPDLRYYDNGKPYRSVAIGGDGKTALMLRPS
ncbi:MAG: serine/threonine-protein kinase, partial [bacterium]